MESREMLYVNVLFGLHRNTAWKSPFLFRLFGKRVYKKFSLNKNGLFCAVCFRHFNGIVVASLAQCYVKLCWNQLWEMLAVSELYMCGTWSCCLLSIQISHFGLGCKGAHWFGTIMSQFTYMCTVLLHFAENSVNIVFPLKIPTKVHFKYLDDA